MKILYFSWIREKIGKSEEVITLPNSITTKDALLTHLSGFSDGHASAFEDREFIRVAVNAAYVHGDAEITDDDEVAIFPPVTGG